jgi:hypothetical protein
MAAPRVTDPREAERRERLVRELDLRRTDPELVMLETTMAGRPESPLMTKLARLRDERINHHLERLLANPFLPIPEDLPSGHVLLGVDKVSGRPVAPPFDAWGRNTVIYGAPGTGKTSIARNITRQHNAAGVKAWVLDDSKESFLRLAIDDPDYLVLDGNAALPLLQDVPYLSRQASRALFVAQFKLAFWGGQYADAVLWDALRTLDGPCSLDDLAQSARALYRHSDSYQRKNAIDTITSTIEQLLALCPGLATSRNGIPFNSLFEHSLLIPSSAVLSTMQQFLYAFLCRHLLAYNQARGIRNTLTHLLVMDEAHLTWTTSAAAHHIGNEPLMAETLLLGREVGLAALVNCISMSSTHPSLKSAAFVQIALNQTNAKDAAELAQTFGLTTAQSEYLQTQLTRGEGIVRLGDYWRHPVLTVLPPPEPHNHVTAEERAAAFQRIHHLAPTPEPATPADAAPAVPNIPNPTPEPVARPAETERVIALNTAEEALLSVICDAVTPSTPAYKKAGLGLADGDNAAKRLEQKGLIVRERIIIHPGRGGHGMGLAATPAGYARAGKERKVKVRGGSGLAHDYYAERLFHLLPGSTVEAMVGTKSVDLLLPLNTNRDQALLEFLRPVLPPNVTLTEGMLLAIEVESSDPVKTAPNNVQKNHEAGITLTLIAVLPKFVTTTRTHLAKSIPAALQSSFIVTNVLSLLDHLGGPS